MLCRLSIECEKLRCNFIIISVPGSSLSLLSVVLSSISTFVFLLRLRLFDVFLFRFLFFFFLEFFFFLDLLFFRQSSFGLTLSELLKLSSTNRCPACIPNCLLFFCGLIP